MAFKDAEKIPGAAVALGEVTGHSHRVVARAKTGAQLWRDAIGQTFVRPKRKGSALALDHEEHKRTPLPKAPTVRITVKRAYDADHGWRAVAD